MISKDSHFNGCMGYEDFMNLFEHLLTELQINTLQRLRDEEKIPA